LDDIVREWVCWERKGKAYYARHALILDGNGSSPVSHYLGREVPEVCPKCGRSLLHLRGVEKPITNGFLLGREGEVEEITDALENNHHHILIRGEKGVGKTAILRKVIETMKARRRKVIYIENSKTWSEVVMDIFKQLHSYGDIDLFEDPYAAELEIGEFKELASKIPSYDKALTLARNLYDKNYIIIADGMEHANKLVFYKLGIILRYIDARRKKEGKKGAGCQFVLATNEIKEVGKDIYIWCKEMEIKPLSREETGEMFDLLLTGRSVVFEDRELTRNHVIIQSGGLPSHVIASVDYILKEVRGVGVMGAGAGGGGDGKVFGISQTRGLGIGVRAEYRIWAMMLYFVGTLLLIMIHKRLTEEFSIVMVIAAITVALGLVIRRMLPWLVRVREK
jgi:hypothetical protein